MAGIFLLAASVSSSPIPFDSASHALFVKGEPSGLKVRLEIEDLHIPMAQTPKQITHP